MDVPQQSPKECGRPVSYPLFRQLFMADILIPFLRELLARDEGPEGAFFGTRPLGAFPPHNERSIDPGVEFCVEKRQNRPI
jgi:hypothetical protein